MLSFRPSTKRGARLGYMGALIAVFEVVVGFCAKHEEYRALVESSFDGEPDDATRLADWQMIQDPEKGELAVELCLQNTFLVSERVINWSCFF